MEAYEAPRLIVLGSFEEVTLGLINKVGTNPDQYSPIIPILVGSVTPAR